MGLIRLAVFLVLLFSGLMVVLGLLATTGLVLLPTNPGPMAVWLIGSLSSALTAFLLAAIWLLLDSRLPETTKEYGPPIDKKRLAPHEPWPADELPDPKRKAEVTESKAMDWLR